MIHAGFKWLAGPLLLGVSAAAPSPLPPPGAAEIPGLIAALGDEQFARRQSATAALWALGPAAAKALHEAAASTDPEVAHRARGLLRRLDLELDPGSDPAVLELIEEYDRAAKPRRKQILGLLEKKQAALQILKLVAADPDDRFRQELANGTASIGVRAARREITAGQPAKARKLLELAPPKMFVLQALAAWHRNHGDLAQTLARATAKDSQAPPAWRLALALAADKPRLAREAALSGGMPEVAALMSMLEGDPLPCLARFAENNDGLDATYAQLARRRWLGHLPTPTDLAPLTTALASRRKSDRMDAVRLCHLIGEPEQAEPVFAKDSPLDAFEMLDNSERVDEALRVLGFDPARPDYVKWAAERFASLAAGDEPDDTLEPRTELVTLARFLHTRGLHRELAAAFDHPLAELCELKQSQFNALVQDLTGTARQRAAGREPPAVAGPLLRMAPAWAGKDEGRWMTLVNAALGESSELAPAWQMLADIAPDSPPDERFAALLALGGLDQDATSRRDQWFARIWEHLQKAAPEALPDLASTVEAMLREVPDAAGFVRLHGLRKPPPPPAEREPDEDEEPDIDALPPDEPIPVSVRLHDIIFLSAAGRWEEAAAAAAQVADSSRGSAYAHAWAAACLRRAGQADRAASHDTRADHLSLGDAAIAMDVSQVYGFCGDPERARRWLRRAVLDYQPGDAAPSARMFSLTGALGLLYQSQLTSGNWAQAAATAEVRALLLLQSAEDEPLFHRHARQQADLARGLALLATDRPRALAMLAHCHALTPCDGSLADDFFPALRRAGLMTEHDRWFAITWEKIQAVVRRFPQGHNSRNTAAWLAGRARLQLPTAERQLRETLQAHPHQGAYLDTMAEIQFAMGRRKEALKWSAQAINYLPFDDAVRNQYHRFEHDPLPK